MTGHTFNIISTTFIVIVIVTVTVILPMQSNDQVDVVSSQHAAYNTQQKALGKDNFIAIPPGVSPVIIIIIMIIIIIIIILFTATILIIDMTMMTICR